MQYKQHPEMQCFEVECTSCANKFSIYAVSSFEKTSMCPACHPAFTGVRNIVKEGSVSAFNQKHNKFMDFFSDESTSGN